MKVINLFGGPGTGKSTTAAGLFYLMKLEGLQAELVTEYAKDLVWAQRFNMFEEQGYVFAKQNHRLHVLKDQVDWAITDAPLFLSKIYGAQLGGNFMSYVQEQVDRYDNVNIFLKRVKAYNPNGRMQTEDEAIDLDMIIRTKLELYSCIHFEVEANALAPFYIYKYLTGKDFTQIPWTLSSVG